MKQKGNGNRPGAQGTRQASVPPDDSFDAFAIDLVGTRQRLSK